MLKENNRTKVAIKMSWLSLFSNLALTIFKLFAGILGHSFAMISDAVHSASDVFANLIVIIGVKMSAKASDKKHAYGHERFECVAAIILSVIICATGILIGYVGITKIISKNEIIVPSILALMAAIVCILIKEILYHIIMRAAKKIDSSVLKADAWHHRADSLSSIGSLIGIGGAMLGFPLLDAISSLVICLFIIRAGISIFIDAIGKMTDESCEEKMEKKITEIIKTCEGVIEIDNLRTRKFGDKIYVNVDICVCVELNLKRSHEIAHIVKAQVEEKVTCVKECFVHVNPY